MTLETLELLTIDLMILDFFAELGIVIFPGLYLFLNFKILLLIAE
jgi:hypothetical protein